MPLQRLDLKTLRYDNLAKTVLINARGAIVEISHEALEEFCNRELTKEEAMFKTAEEIKILTRLAERIPADDGKINITTRLLRNNGRFETSAADSIKAGDQ